MPEKLVPLMKDGRPVDLAVTPADFFSRRLHRGDDGAMVTYAEAGYALGDYYEDKTPHDGPKTQRQHEHAQEERRAARAAEKAEAKPEPKPEAKKD